MATPIPSQVEPSAARWQALLGALGGRSGAARGHHARLLTAYRAPHRHYHGLAHLRRCLAWLDAAPATVPGDRSVVEAALWFHDAVYDIGAADNEFRSAEWAWCALRQAGVVQVTCRRVARLILATRRHLADDADTALTVDIDLAVLGSSPKLYDDYERAVRREYAQVPEALFRSTRAGLLATLLQRPRIYHSRYFRLRLEAVARVNLERAIEALEDF